MHSRNSNESNGRLQIMNSSIGCSSFGMLITEGLCRSRYVLMCIQHQNDADKHLQDLVSGLDGVMFNDLMENIEWFFNLHDKNKDGYLTKDEVLTLSESLLVRHTPNCSMSFAHIVC